MSIVWLEELECNWGGKHFIAIALVGPQHGKRRWLTFIGEGLNGESQKESLIWTIIILHTEIIQVSQICRPVLNATLGLQSSSPLENDETCPLNSQSHGSHN